MQSSVVPLALQRGFRRLLSAACIFATALAPIASMPRAQPVLAPPPLTVPTMKMLPLDEANSILGGPKLSPGKTPQQIVADITPQVKTVVFISSSIPVDRLARLFVSAAGRSSDTVFLFRGWIPPNLSGVTAHAAEALTVAHQLLPNTKIDPNIMIDPTPFDQYNVKVVPSTLTRCADKGWRMSIGELGLEGAEQAACAQPRQIVGATFPVIEPNIIEVIAERAAKVDWEAVRQGVIDRAQSGAFVTSVPLPPSPDAATTLHDPSVALSQDIIVPTSLDPTQPGVLIGRKGQIVNPLDNSSIPPIIVWNPMQASELITVSAWLKQQPNAIIFVTSLALPDGTNAVDKLKHPVYPLTGEVAQRTGVTHTPTLIVQERNKLRLTRARSTTNPPPG